MGIRRKCREQKNKRETSAWDTLRRGKSCSDRYPRKRFKPGQTGYVLWVRDSVARKPHYIY